MLETLLQAFSESDCHTLIVSSEGFDTFGSSDAEFLKDQLSGYVVEVVTVFRHPLHLARSSFCSRGAGGTLAARPSRYLMKFVDNPRSRYSHMLQVWSVFETLSVIKYEDCEDVTSELLKLLGTESGSALSKGRLRRSLNPIETLVLQDVFLAFSSDPAIFREKMYPVYLQFLEEVGGLSASDGTSASVMTPFQLDDQKAFLAKWGEINFSGGGLPREKWSDYLLEPDWHEVKVEDVSRSKDMFLGWLAGKIEVTVERHF